MACADAGSSVIPRRRQRPAGKARRHIAQGMRGVGRIDEVGIEHQVIYRTRQLASHG